MLRRLPFLQLLWWGYSRNRACKRRISGKNLDEVNFWPHWQRFYDSTLMIFFLFTVLVRYVYLLLIAYLRSALKFCRVQRWWKFTQQLCVLTVLFNTKRYIESYFLLHETASQDLFRIWETAQCSIPWIQAGKCHIFIKDMLMSSEWQSSMP